MRRNTLLQELKDEAEETAKIEAELRIMQERRSKIHTDLAGLKEERKELVTTVEEAEITRAKIAESFKSLVTILKRKAI